MINIVHALKGDGRGHWGHGGRPGEIGGSGSTGGSEQYGRISLESGALSQREHIKHSFEAGLLGQSESEYRSDSILMALDSGMRGDMKQQVAENISNRMADNPDVMDAVLEDTGARHTISQAVDEKLNARVEAGEMTRQEYHEERRKLRPGLQSHQMPTKEGIRDNVGEFLSESEQREAIRGHLEHRTSQYIDDWAATSGNTPQAVAMQMAVAKEFGLNDASMGHFNDEFVEKARTDPHITEQDKTRQLFAREQYNETQEYLSNHGINELVVHRGMKFDSAEAAEAAGIKVPEKGMTGAYISQDLSLQPKSSFSSSEYAGASFATQDFTAEGDVSVNITTVVPKERILSTPRSGAGCLPEAEVTVLGGSKVEGVVTVGHADKPLFGAETPIGGMLGDLIAAETGISSPDPPVTARDINNAADKAEMGELSSHLKTF